MALTHLSLSTTHGLALGFAIVYVGSLYVSSKTRLSFGSGVILKEGDPQQRGVKERRRDDPDVIQARLSAVSIASILCCSLVFLILWQSQPKASTTEAFVLTAQRLGLTLGSQKLQPYLLAPLLFLGPMYAIILDSTISPNSKWPFREFLHHLKTWKGIRNYVVAPITEEVVFRACILTVYDLGNLSRNSKIFLSPLSFGVAHAHHAWNTYNEYGRTSAAAKRALFSTLFQLAYTTLFGFYAAFLFTKTGSIYPTISAHIFCNIMGVPQLGSELHQFPRYRLSLSFAYGIGLFGFIVLLGPWSGNTYYS